MPWHASVAILSLVQGLIAFSSEIDLKTLVEASVASEEATGSREAKFLITWTSLCLWIVGAANRREQLYGEQGRPGWPNPGWTSIPAASVVTALNVDGLIGAKLLTEEAYAVLQTNWRRSLGQQRAIAGVDTTSETIAIVEKQLRPKLREARPCDQLLISWASAVRRTRRCGKSRK